MKPSQVQIEIGGVLIQGGGNFSFDSERPPAIVMRLVHDYPSDQKLAKALVDGKLLHEDFEAGPVRFSVTRVRRSVDSGKADEVVWEFWD